MQLSKKFATCLILRLIKSAHFWNINKRKDWRTSEVVKRVLKVQVIDSFCWSCFTWIHNKKYLNWVFGKAISQFYSIDSTVKTVKWQSSSIRMKFFLGLIPLAALCLIQEITAQEYNYQLGAPSPYGAPQGYAPAHSYSPPVYNAKPSYGPVKVGPAQSYTYPSPSPPVPCPTNLLLR